MPSDRCQRICPYNVCNIRHKRRVLLEPRSHHQQRSQRWTCYRGRLQITTRRSPTLDSSAWVKWTSMGSSCALTMTYASPTNTFGRRPSTMFPGDTRAQSIGTNLIWSYSGVPLSRTFYTHALTTVRIATQTTPWCVAISGYNQRGSIALSNRGTPVLMSARYHNHTSGHNLRMLLREFGAPQPNDSATEKWDILRDTMHRTSLSTGAEGCEFDPRPGQYSRMSFSSDQVTGTVFPHLNMPFLPNSKFI